MRACEGPLALLLIKGCANNIEEEFVRHPQSILNRTFIMK